MEEYFIDNFGIPERVEVLENFPTEARFNSVVFYRLALSKVFPELKRVIYLDCDIIALGDILKLWNEELNGHPRALLKKMIMFPTKK
jgi:lipopolysaccharide biosynthesis glycosyltransferase